MGLFGRLFRRGEGNKTRTVGTESPGDRRPAIYVHVQNHLRPDRSGLTPEGQTLPDEERFSTASPIRWAAGAKDGVATHHFGGSDADAAADLLRRLLAYCESPTATSKTDIYDFLLERGVVSLLDPFIELLGKQEALDHSRLYDLARSFALGSPDREPVKFGIALLGVYDRAEDLDVFRTLGLHDEFTLYCAVPLGNTDDAERELYDLARGVHGWGRVHCVERLASIAESSEVTDWLLREGYKNSVMYEYLAYPCAVGGGLLERLSQGDIDKELFQSAGEILRALMAGGPAANLDDYEDGPSVVDHYLRYAEHRASRIGDLLTVLAVRDFLENEEADWDARLGRGWSNELREELRSRCRDILDRPEWPDRVRAGLVAVDEQVFFDANQAATKLDVDAWHIHWKRLQASPLDSGRWFNVMQSCNPDRIGEIVSLAEQSLPLDRIASGPGTEMVGLGPGFEGHSCLDYILQDLGRFPGHGTRLVEAGLQSPIVRNRNMSLKALSGWGKEHWPAGMTAVLERARDAEPDADVRRRMENALADRPIESSEDNRESPAS